MTKRRTGVSRSKVASVVPDTAGLLRDLRRLIGDARRAAAAAVNMSLTALYWRVGKRMRDEVLGQARAEYGEQIVATLSRQLASEYGRGFEEKNLRRMMQFAEAFPDEAVAEYLTELPPRDVLHRRLQAAIESAQARFTEKSAE